jgi:hypothetical protein
MQQMGKIPRYAEGLRRRSGAASTVLRALS